MFVRETKKNTDASPYLLRHSIEIINMHSNDYDSNRFCWLCFLHRIRFSKI